MAIKYRYEKFYLKVDNTSQIEIGAYDDAHEGEQCWITLDFAAGATVNSIENRVTTVMNIVRALKRSEP